MRTTFAVLSGLISALVLASGSASAATEPLPVPYSFLPAAILGGFPGANAPGTNDWTCKPSARHPRPVVLVHGTGGNRSTNWPTYGPLLKNNGYCVFALTYGEIKSIYPIDALGGLADMRTSAEQLSTFVNNVLTATGAHQVDLIGHSQGTLMPNYYVKYLGGATKVGTYISLAPLWHGTNAVSPITLIAGAFGISPEQIPICTACGQFAPGTTFMQQIRAGGAAAPGVRYVNIMSKYDEAVLPYTSGIEVGMTNIVLQNYCPLDFTDHVQIASDKNASIFVLNALDPAHPRASACSLVLPFVGNL